MAIDDKSFFVKNETCLGCGRPSELALCDDCFFKHLGYRAIWGILTDSGHIRTHINWRYRDDIEASVQMDRLLGDEPSARAARIFVLDDID